jgi:hypothetical protein
MFLLTIILVGPVLISRQMMLHNYVCKAKRQINHLHSQLIKNIMSLGHPLDWLDNDKSHNLG